MEAMPYCGALLALRSPRTPCLDMCKRSCGLQCNKSSKGTQFLSFDLGGFFALARDAFREGGDW